MALVYGSLDVGRGLRIAGVQNFDEDVNLEILHRHSSMIHPFREVQNNRFALISFRQKTDISRWSRHVFIETAQDPFWITTSNILQMLVGSSVKAATHCHCFKVQTSSTITPTPKHVQQQVMAPRQKFLPNVINAPLVKIDSCDAKGFYVCDALRSD